MFLDRALAGVYRARVAWGNGVDILVDAWRSAPPDHRAAMIAGQGDLHRAGLRGGAGWKKLAEGDAAGALRVARAEKSANPALELLEAEALLALGAIVAGFDCLDALHRRGNAAASLVLARRRHMLGDHAGAEQVALALPIHAQAALTGARAALMNDRARAAIRYLEPFLDGSAPIPEPMVAGMVAVTAASALARIGRFDLLGRFARRLLEPADLPPDMMPFVARAAWHGGLAAQAWERFRGHEGHTEPWMAAARLELALLAGDAERALRLMEQAGPMGAPSEAALALLSGAALDGPAGEEAGKLFREGVTVHVWRTHPHRWQPWIEAALRTPAEVGVFDLAAGELPDAQVVPQVVLDDSALIHLLPPVPVPGRGRGGAGVWIGEPLCRGAGVDLDWPERETVVIEAAGLPAAGRDDAAVWVLGTDEALPHVHEGRAIVAVARPGDPFWAGPIPERVWPALRVVRPDPRERWNGAGARVADAARTVLNGAGARCT